MKSRDEIINDINIFTYYRYAHNKYDKLKECKSNGFLYKYYFGLYADRKSVIQEIIKYRKGYQNKNININECVSYLLPHQKEAWLKWRI